MRLVVWSICIGFLIIGNLLEVAAINQPNQPKLSSLDPYGTQEPLIIRAHVPDNFRTREEDFDKKGETYLDPQGNVLVQDNIINFLRLFQEDSLIPSAFFIINSPISGPSTNSEAQFLNIAQNSQSSLLPDSDTGSIADFASLFNSESSFGAVLMSFEEKNPQTSEGNFYFPGQLTQSKPVVLVPAELQFSTDGSNDIKNKLQQIIFNEKEVSATNQPIRINKENKENGYTIEKVPEVASFARFGPLSSSDFPSFSEIQAIFDNAAKSTANVNQNTKVYNQNEKMTPITSLDSKELTRIVEIGNSNFSLLNKTNILPSFNGNNIIPSNNNQAGFTPPNAKGFNTNRLNNTETVTIKPIKTINIGIKDDNLSSVKKTNQKLLKTSINSESTLKSLKEKNVNLPNLQNVNDINSLSSSSANNTLSSTRFNIRLRLPNVATPSKLFRTISQPVNTTSNANVLNTIEPATVEYIKSQNVSLIIEDENKNNGINDTSRSNAEISFSNRVRLPNVEEGNQKLFMPNGVNKTLESQNFNLSLSVDNSGNISNTSGQIVTTNSILSNNTRSRVADTDIFKAIEANSTESKGSEVVPVFSGEAYNRYNIDDGLIIKNTSKGILAVNLTNVETPLSTENANQDLSLPDKINEPVQKGLFNNEATFSLPNESNSSALEFGSPQNISTIDIYENNFQTYNNSEVRNVEPRADIHRNDINTNNTNNSVDNNSFIPGLLNESNSPKLLDLNKDNETIIGIVPVQGLNLSAPVQIQDNDLNNSLININNDNSVIYRVNNKSNQELLGTTQGYEAITSALPENLNFTVSARYYNFTTDNESQIILPEEVTNSGLRALNDESLVNETISEEINEHLLFMSNNTEIVTNIDTHINITSNNETDINTDFYKENNESNQGLLGTTQRYEAITSTSPENLNFTISARYYNFMTDNESQTILPEEETNPGLRTLNEESLVNETTSEELHEHLLSISNNTEVITNIDTPINVTSNNDTDISSINAGAILLSEEDRYRQISLNSNERTDSVKGSETTTLEAATISIANSDEISVSVEGDETTTIKGEARSIDVLNSNGITDSVEEAERTTLKATTISVGSIISDINYNSESTTIIDSDF